MEQWILSWWHVIASVLGLIVIPSVIWAIRTGLASKSDLAAETQARGDALVALETRLGQRLAGIEDEQAELSDRTLRIETEIGHLPTSDDIAELKAAVGRTDTRFEGMLREMQSIVHSLARIEDRLMKGTGA